MKNKARYLIGIAAIGLAMATFTWNIPAQTISLSSIDSLLKDGVITLGQPVTIKGQTFMVTTNASGGYVITTSGPGGDITIAPPTSAAEALSRAQKMLADNNPLNASFYGTNEVVGRVGAVYLQNSGQAVVEIGVEKYGWFSQKIGLGAALFQGNKDGQSGTAGAVAFVDYRKVIGDVSAQFGAGGGYDNWNKSWMFVTKVDIELRQNAHVGEYVGVAYAVEKATFGGASATANKGGLMVRGGINYAF